MAPAPFPAHTPLVVWMPLLVVYVQLAGSRPVPAQSKVVWAEAAIGHSRRASRIAGRMDTPNAIRLSVSDMSNSFPKSNHIGLDRVADISEQAHGPLLSLLQRERPTGWPAVLLIRPRRSERVAAARADTAGKGPLSRTCALWALIRHGCGLQPAPDPAAVVRAGKVYSARGSHTGRPAQRAQGGLLGPADHIGRAADLAHPPARLSPCPCVFLRSRP